MHENPGPVHDDSRTEQPARDLLDQARQPSHATANLSDLNRPGTIYLLLGSAANHGVNRIFHPLNAFLQREDDRRLGHGQGRFDASALQYCGQALNPARRHAHRLSSSVTEISSVHARAWDSSGSQSPAVEGAADDSPLPVSRVLDVQASAPARAPERTSRRARRES
ncbi:hypothetical protein GCM10022214_52300 [Actinomadura miaoliensis]|uniref:Uncharacterized protein n=1 Tax=Actinomadura miaoliensis TaxID=430685 RepID=A0ABP7WC79_9ACTN